jgi:hypothetical protein
VYTAYATCVRSVCVYRIRYVYVRNYMQCVFERCVNGVYVYVYVVGEYIYRVHEIRERCVYMRAMNIFTVCQRCVNGEYVYVYVVGEYIYSVRGMCERCVFTVHWAGSDRAVNIFIESSDLTIMQSASCGLKTRV